MSTASAYQIGYYQRSVIVIANIKTTNEILQIISELDSFKNSWGLIGKISPEKLVSLKKIATIESIGSSTRIEGAKY